MARYRLNESRLRNMIREAIKSELGMNNQQKINRRNERYINESRLRGMIREDIKSIFSRFSKNKGVDDQPTPENPQDDIPKGRHIYAPKELQWLYDNQDGLSKFQQDVLTAAMWVRAMRAGYHGYTKEWHCIAVDNGRLYYFDKNNEMKKVPMHYPD